MTTANRIYIIQSYILTTAKYQIKNDLKISVILYHEHQPKFKDSS